MARRYVVASAKADFAELAGFVFLDSSVARAPSGPDLKQQIRCKNLQRSRISFIVDSKSSAEYLYTQVPKRDEILDEGARWRHTSRTGGALQKTQAEADLSPSEVRSDANGLSVELRVQLKGEIPYSEVVEFKTVNLPIW